MLSSIGQIGLGFVKLVSSIELYDIANHHYIYFVARYPRSYIDVTDCRQIQYISQQ